MNSCNNVVHAVCHGYQRGKQIVLIAACCANTCITFADTFFFKQVRIRTVAENDVCFGNRTHQFFAAIPIDFNELHTDFVFYQSVCQCLTKITAADEHYRADGLPYQINTGKEIRHLIFICNDSYHIPGMEFEFTLRNHQLIAAKHTEYKKIRFQQRLDAAKLCIGKDTVLFHDNFSQQNAGIKKRLHAVGGIEIYLIGNGRSCKVFRRQYVVNAEFFLQIGFVRDQFLSFHFGNRIPCPEVFCHGASQQVDLVYRRQAD